MVEYLAQPKYMGGVLDFVSTWYARHCWLLKGGLNPPRSGLDLDVGSGVREGKGGGNGVGMLNEKQLNKRKEVWECSSWSRLCGNSSEDNLSTREESEKLESSPRRAGSRLVWGKASHKPGSLHSLSLYSAAKPLMFLCRNVRGLKTNSALGV